jgi:hypothetical protein
MIRKFLALATWGYVVVKLLVFDVDQWIVTTYVPRLAWLVQYRGLAILALLAIALLVFTWRAVLVWVAYILFYPFILLFWDIPKLLIKTRNWTLGLALVAAGVSLFRSFRFTVSVAASVAIGSAIALTAHSLWLLAVGVLLLLGSLFTVYAETLIAPFRTHPDFFSDRALEKIQHFLEQFCRTQGPPRDVRPEGLTDVQRETWLNNLFAATLFNRACYFVASKLRDLKRSRLNAAGYILRVLMLFGWTVWAFALSNLAVFKIFPGHFRVAVAAAPFDFIWYGFNSVYGRMVAEVVPVSQLARVLFMAATVSGALILGVAVMFVFTSVRSSRASERMDEIVAKIRRHGDSLEVFMGQEYGMTVAVAIQELAKVRAGVVGILYYLTPDPPDDTPLATKGNADT